MRRSKPSNVEYHNLRRKLVANMTAESWHTTPHAGSNYEPDVTVFWDTYQALRKEDPRWEGVTANALLLYTVTQGLKACPKMNGHSYFSLQSATGRVEYYNNIDITMPMVLPGGGMMAVNVRHCEQRSLPDLSAAVEDVRRRMERSNLNEAMLWPSALDGLKKACRGRPDILIARFIGNTLGHCRMPLLLGKARREYYAIPEEDRLTWRDIEQGTVMVSNFGSVYRGSYAPPALLDIIPPQICVIGIGGMVERPGVVTNPDGSKEIAPRKYIPFQIIFDHRAIDYADTVPFMKRLDALFSSATEISSWI